jgi:hypothetical protein
MTVIEFLRQFRIGEYALFDLSASFLGMWILSPLLSKLFSYINIHIPKRNWLYLTLPIGILAHLLSGRITPMTQYALDVHGHYLLKALLIILTFFGLRHITRIKKLPQ